MNNKEKQWDKKHTRMYQIIKWVWKFCHIMSTVLSGPFSPSDFLLGTENTQVCPRITQTEHCWNKCFKNNSLITAAAAAAAKSLQSCPTLCDPIDGSPPGSPSLGFSRQEYWSGLPFPFPMHEREKWKQSSSVMSDSSRPHGLQPTRLLRPWDLPSKSTGVGCHRLLLNH